MCDPNLMCLSLRLLQVSNWYHHSEQKLLSHLWFLPLSYSQCLKNHQPILLWIPPKYILNLPLLTITTATPLVPVSMISCLDYSNKHLYWSLLLLFPIVYSQHRSQNDVLKMQILLLYFSVKWLPIMFRTKSRRFTVAHKVLHDQPWPPGCSSIRPSIVHLEALGTSCSLCLVWLASYHLGLCSMPCPQRGLPSAFHSLILLYFSSQHLWHTMQSLSTTKISHSLWFALCLE